MNNLFLYGFTGELGNHFYDNIAKKYNIKIWISNTNRSTENIWDFLTANTKNIKFNVRANRQFKNFFENNFNVYLKMTQRRGSNWSSYNEIRNEFAIVYYKFYELFNTNKIDLVIFANLPHEGADYICYQLAKFFNIKTLLFFQSLFANKVFITTRLEDFSEFNSIDTIYTDKVYFDANPFASLLYMKEVDDLSRAKKSYYIYFYNIKYFFYNAYRKISSYLKTDNKKVLKTLLLSMLKVYEYINFKINIRKCSIKEYQIDLLLSKGKVIYIPLHLQPELTTATLGGFYEEQLNIIERISLELKEYVIVIKENPKQGAFQRNNLFFKRLSALDNVFFTNTSYPSSRLIVKSDLIVTVSGTAGWEAIKSGKKCLAFGMAWYLCFSGCYRYNDKIKIKDIIEDGYLFNKDILELEFFKLMSKSADGVVDDSYSPMVKNFTYANNARLLVDSINKAINDENTKW